MAPEDILNSVDDGRREFIRKLITGTTFAVPLMASFSMDGLSIAPAEAQFSNALCANMPPASACCELAEEISVVIGLVVCLTGLFGFEVGASPVVKAKLFKPLAKALQDMSQGILKGGSTCHNRHARENFEDAREDMADYWEALQKLCGPSNDLILLLGSGVGSFLAALDALIAGDCQTGFFHLNNLTTLRQQLHQQFAP